MNRRNFLQFLSAIVPAWLMAKFVKAEPAHSIRVLDVDGVLDVDVLEVGKIVNGWEGINLGPATSEQTTFACPEPPCTLYFMTEDGWQEVGEVQKPIVHARFDASGYHVFRNGEKFTLTNEGFVKA